MNLQILAGPLIGGIIGLITNGIAIRMLFRPLKPVRIFGITLPFTPGIIPKEKPRIARSVGRVVGSTLVNAEVLKRGLLSDTVDARIHSFVLSFFTDLQESDRTLGEILLSHTSEAKATELLQKTSDKSTTFLFQKINDMALGDLLASVALEELTQNSMFSAFSFLLNQNTLNALKDKIAETVDTLIENRGEELIRDMVNRELSDVINTPCSEIVSRFSSDYDKLADFAVDFYHKIVNEKLDSALETLDIAHLVESQINGFDVLELEKIILDIMHKELNAIIWLGGLLGLIMGIVMIFV